MFGKKEKSKVSKFPFPKNGYKKEGEVAVLPVKVEDSNVEILVPSQVEPQPVVEPSAPKRNVADFFKSFTGKNVTSEQTTRELMVADENLDMKTEIRDPIAMSLWDAVGEYAESRGYPLTAATYRSLAVHIRKNMVSFQRGSRRELERILTADMERCRDEDMSALDRGFGMKQKGVR